MKNGIKLQGKWTSGLDKQVGTQEVVGTKIKVCEIW